MLSLKELEAKRQGREEIKVLGKLALGFLVISGLLVLMARISPEEIGAEVAE